jgi:AcrR family transcriptional regulator
MCPRTEKQYEEIRSAKRKSIMNTALELFSEKGYYATSINDISEKAEISKGLTYNYFSSKEALLNDIVINGLEEITEIFDPNKDGFLTEEEFDFFIDKIFDVLKKNIPFWRLYYSLLMKSEIVSIIRKPMSNYMAPFLKTLTDYYKRHGKEDPKASAVFFVAVLDGISLNYITAPDLYPLSRIKKILKVQLK